MPIDKENTVICNIHQCLQKNAGVSQVMTGILAVCLERWRTCAVTPCVLHTIQWGYQLQFLSFQALQALQVQNAYSASPVIPSASPGLVYISEFDRCIFSHHNPPRSQKFSEVFFSSRGLHTSFGSCRSPRIFTKCAEAMLAPLRRQGMRVF